MGNDDIRADDGAAWGRWEGHPFFAGLDQDCLTRVTAALGSVPVTAGTRLIRQGELGASLFVVRHGRFAVDFTDDHGRVRRVGEIGPGEVFGEMALLLDEPRATTVRALRDSEVGQLSRAEFEAIAATHPVLFQRLAARLADRLRRANRRAPASSTPRAVAVVPHRADGWFADWCDALVAALGSRDAVHVVRRDVRAESDRISFLAGLAEREASGERLVYVTEPEAPAWNRMCVAQADTVLVVARASDDPEPGPVEALIPEESPAPRELVLCHASGATPQGTRRWLTPGRFFRHHHVREGDRADVARVARWVSGRAVGLALGGGGARAFAHLGVMQALEEARVPVDAVAGTSFGSLIGAQIALGWTAAERRDRTAEAFRVNPMQGDLTLPLLSLGSCHNVVKLLRDWYGSARLEDTWVPLFTVTCSLTRAASVVRRDGLVWQRVRESGALPGVAPPVIADGEFLVDGAVFNNLPADVLQQAGAGRVIAVNVSPRDEIGTDWPDTHRLSGWQVLGSRWSRKRAPLPSLLWVLQRTVLLHSVASVDRLRDEVDLYLDPPVERFGMFDWGRSEEIAACGYAHAVQRVGAWSG